MTSEGAPHPDVPPTEVQAAAEATLHGREDHLVRLDREHPGFRDPLYRKRRDAIARSAYAWREGETVPDVTYTEGEQAVWRAVGEKLAPLHERRACRAFHEAAETFQLSFARIPQFAEVNRRLAQASGFTLAPVAGLVTPRYFLSWLGRDIFLATQYMRHESTPLYTPEPDVVHELVGHAVTLTHPDFVALNRMFGAAIADADEAFEQKLIRVYWWTVEFGLVIEDGEEKAYGAGLLSSFGELGRFQDHAQRFELDFDHAAATPFDPTDYQRQLFVAKSWSWLLDALPRWLASARPTAA